uniref:Uncharacterized protein n=1 Tax=Oryza glumipatula TaxID=40148 RepID=A0A0D9ZHY7_9ORYZ
MARRGGELRRGGCRARVLGGGDGGGDGETGPAENACATLPEDTRELLVLEWARLGCHGCQLYRPPIAKASTLAMLDDSISAVHLLLMHV